MSKQDTSPGRPRDEALQKVRKDSLLDAAYALLAEKSYRSITIREIAKRAGMQSAMISYYFGDKEGLFMALLDRVAQRNFSQFEGALEADNPIKAFIHRGLSVFADLQPIVRLVVDEILTQQSRLRDRFVELMPQRMARMLPALIQAQQARGLLRTQLDPKWTAFSLMSLMITPFLAAPVRKDTWQISDETVSSEAWAEHIYQLFMQGAGDHGQ